MRRVGNMLIYHNYSYRYFWQKWYGNPRYQRLFLESQFADKQLASAMASLEEARNEARRKQAYVERIVQPNLPDDPLEPRRLRGILSTLILGLAAWAIISMLVAGMLEHRD